MYWSQKEDLKNSNQKIYNELFQFYLKTENKAFDLLKDTIKNLFNQSIMKSLESENILIPNQFPPQLVKFLKDNLKISNNIVESSTINNSKSEKVCCNMLSIASFRYFSPLYTGISTVTFGLSEFKIGNPQDGYIMII